ncbi:fructose-bisphosphate aldolase, partial [Candidatus Micrarchaeota archaeon CG_4_10_14_0_8_um_filter_60_7]
MEAMPGAKAFNALRDSDGIILAVNPRVCTGVLDGVFRAAKANDAVVIFELARTECSLDGGYTGLTPAGFAAIVKHAAEKVGFREWVLHADHLTVKSKSRIEMNDLKALVDAQIDAGYTSFAVDASFLYAGNALDTREALEDNAAATVEIFEHVSEN